MLSILALSAILITTSTCTMVHEDPPPADFGLRYEWREPSVPPPHHYEYTVYLGPGPTGRIDFHPDYPSEDPPLWSEPLTLTGEDLGELYRLLAPARREPRAGEGPPEVAVGGAVESLEVTAGGETARLDLSTPSGEEIRRAIRERVPETVWRDLMARRARYMESHTAE